MSDLDPDLHSRYEKIKLLILDIDGVLTDGRVIYANHGDELKCFDVHDGFGIKLILKSEIKVVIITAKKSRLNQRRAKDLGVNKIYQGAHDKLRVYEKVLKKYRMESPQACFVADDWMDIPVLKRVGLAVAVANALPEVKSAAHYVTKKAGGRGAVREVVNIILDVQNKRMAAAENYFR